tara:strand:+ start:157 stop:474 length:318 start_codon:yes stop_codon:yes gene_type:complete
MKGDYLPGSVTVEVHLGGEAIDDKLLTCVRVYRGTTTSFYAALEDLNYPIPNSRLKAKSLIEAIKTSRPHLILTYGNRSVSMYDPIGISIATRDGKRVAMFTFIT